MSELQEAPIQPPPGVVKTDSARVIEGRWRDMLNSRFIKGLPQKINGWVKAFADATIGVPRALHAWRDRSFNPFMAVGTYIKLYVYDQNGAQNDITPYRDQGTLGANPITTTAGSNLIVVHDVAHGLSPGDLIYLAGITAVGGIAPNVSGVPTNTVLDADNYTYLFTSNATSSATGGGAAVTYKYEIPVGVELGTYGYGWGVGTWGIGTWGTAHSSSTIYIEPRVWSLDEFGVLLLASYNGGTIYQFDPTASQPWGRATVISTDPGLPANVRAMVVTPERFVLALCDNLQVIWPSQGTLTDWTPTATNTANIRTLTVGSKLVGGRVLADFVTLVWTDAALYKFQYTGSAFVYSSSMVAKDCGLISPNAAITIGGVAFWMGQNNFWMFNGSVTPMPNVEDIRKWLFDQIDINMGYQCNAVYNPTNNEVWFFVTLHGQTTPTLGVIFSIDQQCWAPLYWGRVGGTHYTQGDTRPYMGDVSGFIYQHEVGLDADGAVLPYSWSLAPYAVTKGGRYNIMTEYMVTDMKDQAGTMTFELDGWDRLNDSAVIDIDTETVAVTDSGTIDMRVSGRYIAFTAAGNSLGCYSRMGLPVVFYRTIGDRS